MLGRIRKHASKQDWFAVALDLGILVFGVFLGIEASNWNQDRLERSDARDLHTQIIDNLEANEADLAARASYYRQVRVHAVDALRAAEAPVAALGEQFLIDSYQASQAWLRPLQRTAYDELTASGLGRKLGNAQAREAMSAFYVSVEGFETTGLGVTAYRDQLRRAMDLATQEKIRTRCGDVMEGLPGGGVSPTLPRNCTIGMDARLAQRAAARVAAMPGFREELTRLIVDIDQKQALFARTRHNAAQLRRQLEARRLG